MAIFAIADCSYSSLVCSTQANSHALSATSTSLFSPSYLLILFPFGWFVPWDVRRLIISYAPLTMSNVRTPSSRNLIAIVKTHGQTQPERHLSSSALFALFSAASFPAICSICVECASFFSSFRLLACLPVCPINTAYYIPVVRLKSSGYYHLFCISFFNHFNHAHITAAHWYSSWMHCACSPFAYESKASAISHSSTVIPSTDPSLILYFRYSRRCRKNAAVYSLR